MEYKNRKIDTTCRGIRVNVRLEFTDKMPEVPSKVPSRGGFRTGLVSWRMFICAIHSGRCPHGCVRSTMPLSATNISFVLVQSHKR